MPKVKIPRKNVSLDMTAMCDVAFLLLTFFILTTSFKPDEPVVVDTPTSISEKKLEQEDVMIISLDKEGRAFFSVDDPNLRGDVLESMGAKYNIKFTDAEKQEFANMSSVGVSVEELSQLLKLPPFERKNYKQSGIPYDSTNNQLADWINYSFSLKAYLKLGLKGDKDTKYEATHKVINTIVDKYNSKFYFVTGLEENPNQKKK